MLPFVRVDVFFIKQKTAYEMRISDWSSDVCSSDLCKKNYSTLAIEFCLCGQARLPRWPIRSPQRRAMATGRTSITGPALAMRRCKRTLLAVVGDAVRLVDLADDVPVRLVVDRDRSEEHTSELQSLMRISYAVFCLKKNIKQKNKLTSYM